MKYEPSEGQSLRVQL